MALAFVFAQKFCAKLLNLCTKGNEREIFDRLVCIEPFCRGSLKLFANK